jgi:RNA polymerase sigma-70 factor (ECF subfamily)
MRPADTSLGGNPRAFPETTSELVERFQDGTGEQFRLGFEVLCQRYWKPIYVHIRAAWGKTNEDAKDLTQAFFLWLMEGDALNGFERERGSFRRFIKVLLRSFVGHRETALKRLKRGGGLRFLRLDEEAAIEQVASESQGADPERLFEEMWVAEVVNQAVERVRERHCSRGGALPFEVYEAFALKARSERVSYAQLASTFGLTEAMVRKYLFTVREEIRGEIRTQLARSTSNPAELEREWNELFGS